MIFPRFPLPSLETICVIYKIGKKIWDTIKNSDIKNKPEITSKSSVHDINDMAIILNEIQQDALKEGSPIVNEIKDNIISYIEELSIIVDSKAKVLKKYKYSRRSFDYTLKEINKNVQDFWNTKINQKISLDNLECRSILKLPPGIEKENAMKAFVSTVIKDTTIAYTNNIKYILYQLYTDFECDIDEIINEIELSLDSYNKMDISLFDKDNLSYEQNLKIAQSKVFICTKIIKELEK